MRRHAIWVWSILVSLITVGFFARADYYRNSGWYSPPPTYQAPTFYPNYGSSFYGGSFFGGESSGPRISIDMNPQHNLDSDFRIAAREDRLKDVVRLLHKGAHINSRSDTGDTALMYAAGNCSEKVVRILLNHRANVNMKNDLGETALVLAVRDDCLPVAKLLIDIPGIALQTRDKTGKTASDYAIEHTFSDVDGPSSQIVKLLDRRKKGTRERL